MTRNVLTLTVLALTAFVRPCRAETGTLFGGDLEFLRKHTGVVLLEDASHQAQVAVVPAWQGRVMTSAARGTAGESFGWVNRELIASGKKQPHINVFGGEDRFWLGPEGGQYSIFFAGGVPFDFEHWFTPASLDTEPFEVISQSTSRVVCQRTITFTNRIGTRFSLEVTREVRLLKAAEALAESAVTLPPGVSAVAYESVNTVKNTGDQPWKKETGLLSVWILGMFNASEGTTVVIPFEKGTDAERGLAVNDTYFGKVPAERLVVKDGVLFFRADARKRCKIGLSPRRAKPLLGSYDIAHHILTLVRFTLPQGASEYVNSQWKQQDDPFSGDVVNSYTDDGKLGNFYELESSSPALALQPDASATHRHQTVHLQGGEKELDAVARAVLGVSLEAISQAF